MDRTVSKGYFLIDLERNHGRPVTIDMVLLTGIKDPNKTQEEIGDFDKTEHIAFHYGYRLDHWGDIDRFVVPKDARDILRN